MVYSNLMGNNQTNWENIDFEYRLKNEITTVFYDGIKFGS